jgi:hypothetical protein
VREASKYGLSGSTIVKGLEDILKMHPGYTAEQLVSRFRERHNRTLTIEIINSALYSFEDRRFARSHEHYPRWYCRSQPGPTQAPQKPQTPHGG